MTDRRLMLANFRFDHRHVVLLCEYAPTSGHRSGQTSELGEALLRVILDGLLEGGYVAKCEQKQNDHFFFVSYGRYIDHQPEG